jgi:hypothetical protein
MTIDLRAQAAGSAPISNDSTNRPMYRAHPLSCGAGQPAAATILDAREWRANGRKANPGREAIR